MTDLTTSTTTDTAGTPVQTKPLSLDNLTRQLFEPGDEANAEIAIGKAVAIAEAHKLPVQPNWDTTTPPPAGYALAIIPKMRTRKLADGSGEQYPIAVYIAAMPTPEVIAADGDAGAAWLRGKLWEAIVNRFANQTRGDNVASIPFSVADFITAQGRDNSLAYFRKVVTAYVKLLKDKNVKPTPTANILRDVFSSRAAAEQFYPRVKQTNWEALLDKMLFDSKASGQDPGMVAVWRQTRDSAEIDSGDFDLEGLDGLDVNEGVMHAA